MSSVLPFSPADKSPETEADPRLIGKAVGAIKQILDMLEPAEREQALREITEAIRPIPAPRAGEVLGAIVRLLPSRREWTVKQVKQEIISNVAGATPKAVYNAFGYLRRKGRIRKVGYGRYVFDGGLLETADDLGVEPARYEEDG